MKVCKVVHINDGKPETLSHGNFMFVEEYNRASEILNRYLAEGWEVRGMVPMVTPNMRTEIPAFYCGGITVYLEREEK